MVQHVRSNFALICFSNDLGLLPEALLMRLPDVSNFAFTVIHGSIDTFLSIFLALVMPHPNEQIMREVRRMILLEVVADNASIRWQYCPTRMFLGTLVVLLLCYRGDFHFYGI